MAMRNPSEGFLTETSPYAFDRKESYKIRGAGLRRKRKLEGRRAYEVVWSHRMPTPNAAKSKRRLSSLTQRKGVKTSIDPAQWEAELLAGTTELEGFSVVRGLYKMCPKVWICSSEYDPGLNGQVRCRDTVWRAVGFGTGTWDSRNKYILKEAEQAMLITVKDLNLNKVGVRPRRTTTRFKKGGVPAHEKLKVKRKRRTRET
ncbi:hypothetical protein C8F04DRAFT_1181733 [Mycena alexandri]|uniref:Uncharacterized protein n=1 Tax=Mycena alexandri TaxID=1745969 RepID=A0AAD6T009_9AGAR|nr:hypothetical protein C8F04DRAFT_1181733 [Mycena alexandri]